MRIGFVGLGHMGLPMAKNLLKAQHEVTGFDVQPKAVAALVDAGGYAAKSIQELANNQEVLITMLQTGQQVMQVCMGNTGLFAHVNKDSLYIDCSTIDIKSSHQIHHQADLLDIMVVDAPVSGGVAGAVAGTLTFMVGGKLNAFLAAENILANMGKKIIYTGDAGSGQIAKICNNMVLATTMISISEVFLLAQKLGLSPQKLHEVITNASGQCWVMDHYVPVPDILEHVPANDHYKPGFTTAMMLKDLRLSQDAAASVGVSTPMGKLATELYQDSQEAGLSELDFSIIIKRL